jgi:hypothetical protein
VLSPELRTASVNEILRFYTEDFVPAHAADLITYMDRGKFSPPALKSKIFLRRFNPIASALLGPVKCFIGRLNYFLPGRTMIGIGGRA